MGGISIGCALIDGSNWSLMVGEEMPREGWRLGRRLRATALRKAARLTSGGAAFDGAQIWVCEKGLGFHPVGLVSVR